MKRLCALLLSLALLCALPAQAADPSPAPTMRILVPDFSAAQREDDREAALGLLEQAILAPDFEAQVSLIFQARDLAPGDARVLYNCGQLLFELDTEDAYLAEWDAMLQDALALAKENEPGMVLPVLSTLLGILPAYGRAEEALALAKAAVSENPGNTDFEILLAATEFDAGQPDGALATLENIIAREPGNYTAMLVRAELLYLDCRYDEAIAAYKKIRADWPYSPEGPYGLYITYLSAGEFDMAARAIDAMLSIMDEDSLWLDRANVRLWNQYDPEAALRELASIVRSGENAGDALTSMVNAYIQLEDYDSALETAEQLSEYDPGFSLLLKGVISARTSDWAEAEAHYQRVISEHPETVMVHQNRAEALLQGYDDLEGAMAALAKGFEAFPYGNLGLYVTLGLAYHRQGDYLEAARAFQVGALSTRTDPIAQYYLVMNYADAGRREDMLDALATLERQYPGWYETLVARMIVEDVLGNGDAAWATFEAWKEKFPQPVSLRPQIEGSLRATLGQAEGAEMIRAWIDETERPTAGQWSASYAYALIRLGDLEGAKEALETAATLLAPDDPERAFETRDGQMSIALGWANIALEEGDTDQCVAYFAEAAALGWQPAALALEPQYAAVWEMDAFQALVAQYPVADEPWDVTVPPAIPAA